MIEPFCALILAGGHSMRMGQDKAWLLLGRTPLVELVAQRLLPIASEILFSTGEPDRYRDLVERLPLPSRTVADWQPGGGPLAGLQAGLLASSHELVFAVAADMPFVDPNLVQQLAALSAGVDAVLPTVLLGDREEIEPLHAFYRRACLPAVERALAAGQRRVVSFLPEVKVRQVPASQIAAWDPGFRSFFNVNTPEDYAQAMCMSQTRRK